MATKIGVTNQNFVKNNEVKNGKNVDDKDNNANTQDHVGIVGTGLYIPDLVMTAAEIANATVGVWTEDAIKDKLGIIQKPIPGSGDGDGTQEMGVKAALNLIANIGIDPSEIDLIICMGEEWKEYPLTTSAIYIQEQIKAYKAWGFDLQQRCCTTVTAMKVAKDMMLQDEDIKVALIVGGYRNGDFVDYKDPDLSMMYNLAAGGGAILLKRNYGRNVLLGSHIVTDGSLARDVGVEFGGTVNPIDKHNLKSAAKSLRLFNPQHMKDRLNKVSLTNWFSCIDKALKKSIWNGKSLTRPDLTYLAILHFKRSMHYAFLDQLKLQHDQSIYLEDYGHLGQVDQILSLHLALQSGQVRDRSVVSMIAAGIGYTWAANVIRWGSINDVGNIKDIGGEKYESVIV